MPRPHIFLTNTCMPSPTAKLDPRYHPLGQPGPKHRGPVWICKVPPGFRLPAMVLSYCFITWNLRRWLFPHRCRTIHNVELPMHTEREVEGVWYERFRKQTDIYRWGHIYAAMQEKRIRAAKKRGVLPANYPENEEQLNRMDKDTFEAMMPEVKKLKFVVDKDRIDGVCALRQKLPDWHGQEEYYMPTYFWYIGICVAPILAHLQISVDIFNCFLFFLHVNHVLFSSSLSICWFAFCENLPACIYASTWIILIWTIIVPFEIYATIGLYKCRLNVGVKTRYPAVIIGSAIFSIIHTLIVEQFYYLQRGINLSVLNSYYVRYIARIIFPPFLLILLVGITFRIYLIHYNTNYAVSQSEKDWQSLLNESESDALVGFYAKHKKTYGSPLYVSRYFICYILIGSVIEMTVTILEHPNLLNLSQIISGFIHFTFLFVLILFCAFCGHKTPTFEDAYFVHLELKYLLYLFPLCLVTYIVMNSLSSDKYPIFVEISTSAITIANFGQVVISEYVILRKMNETQYRYHNSPKPKSRSRVRTKSNVNPEKAFVASTKLFNVLIASPIGISYFVQHLRSEFALENLLCFIELVQWIYNISNRDLSHYDLKPLDKIEFELSRAIPLSSANMNMNTDEWRWDDAICAIYKKYFESQSEYQVNMPYKAQKEFDDLIALLNTKYQIENETYTFKHQRISLKKKRKGNRVLFWTKKSKQSKAKVMTMNTVNIPSSIKAPHKTPTAMIHDQTAISTKTSKSTTDGTVLSATTAGIDLEMGAFPKHLLKLSNNPGTLTSAHSNSLKTPTFKSHYDSDEITAEMYKDPELTLYEGTEMTSTTTTTMGTNTEQILHSIFVDEMQRSSKTSKDRFKLTDKVSNSSNSLRIQLKRISSMIPKLTKNSKTVSLSTPNSHSHFSKNMHINLQSGSVQRPESTRHAMMSPSNPWTNPYGFSVRDINEMKDGDDESVNDLYLSELKDIERAKNLGFDDVVPVVCAAIYVVLGLNHQSVGRFKQSDLYAQFLESVNLDNLLERFGDKGAF